MIVVLEFVVFAVKKEPSNTHWLNKRKDIQIIEES